MKSFLLCFVPLFVAVDAIGILPIFLGLTEGMKRSVVRRVAWQSVLTATGVTLLFVAIGKLVLQMLGITVEDFMIAGGTLLFVISLGDMLTLQKLRSAEVDAESIGAVPIGVPLMAGPAVLTTSLLLVDQHGIGPTAAALVANIAFAGVVFWFSETIQSFLGNAGAKTVSKLANLVLASIAVMLVRKGIIGIITHPSQFS